MMSLVSVNHFWELDVMLSSLRIQKVEGHIGLSLLRDWLCLEHLYKLFVAQLRKRILAAQLP